MTPTDTQEYESIGRRQERMNREHPAVLIDGHLVHVFGDEGDWEVWLNCEDLEFSGLCIGTGETRQAAVTQAVAALEAILDHLQGPAGVPASDGHAR